MTKIQQQLIEVEKALLAYPLSEDNVHLYKKKFLGSRSEIQKLFHQLPNLSNDERKAVGKKINDLKQLAKARYTSVKVVRCAPREVIDSTLPPPSMQVGSLHILTQCQEKVIEILERIGFQSVEGPEIEDEWHNFGALNFPPYHPAREMQDTFFVKTTSQEKIALRTQTSSVQIRIMERSSPPIRILSVGRVFRKETISARSHCAFHQVEGLYVNKNVSFLELREVLTYFVHTLFGKDINMRLRPSYFPFTEPSAEIDIACLICKGSSCTVCKKTGWVEIGGAGMVDPKVLENCAISPAIYTGFAFGIGIERIAMLLAQVPDIRLFMENDLRFLKQFA